MSKVNIPTQDMGQYAGKWVAIDPNNQRIVAVGETLKDIAPLVSGSVKDKKKIKASAFLVPRKDEGPYILAVKTNR